METQPIPAQLPPLAPQRARWRLASWGSRSLMVGVTLSVVLHAGAAVAVLAISGGLRSSGSFGTIYMVSFEPGEGHRTSGGMAAFSWSRSFPPATSKLAALPSVALNLAVEASPPKLHPDSLASRAHSQGSLTLSSSVGRKDAAPAVGGELGSSTHARGQGANRSGRALIISPLPPYPEAARRANFQGRVLLEISVAPDGTPRDVSVLRSSGRADCDDSARSTVLHQWRFGPAALASTDKQRVWVRFELR